MCAVADSRHVLDNCTAANRYSRPDFYSDTEQGADTNFRSGPDRCSRTNSSKMSDDDKAILADAPSKSTKMSA